MDKSLGRIGCALLLILPAILPQGVRAERVRNPSLATVFVRVIGKVEVEIESTWTESREERDVELGTGSGFVFTSYGHVLTNYHVVSGSSFTERVGRETVDVQLKVDRIEVVLPSAADGPGTESSRFEASIDAVDPDRDLAVLSVTAGELPYLAFGDSDASEPGDSVQVYGYPFGRRVEVGKTDLPDIVPRVSVTQGSVSAARTDDTGNPSYLQTNATVNPGNSGGPMVDAEGYVLGVIRLKLRGGDGLGFAIPVNAVKDFLEHHGFAQLLPVERLRLGGQQTFPGKALGLRLPDAMEDRSASRLRAASDPSGAAIKFVADRVATPWDLSRLEGLLLSGGTFDSFRSTGGQESQVYANGRLVLGSANGLEDASGRESKLEYALLESGSEKLVVRYLGAADAVAFNRSILQESLRSLRAEPLLTAEISEPLLPDRIEWYPKPLPVPSAPAVVLPGTWESEVASPFPCRGIPPPDSVLAHSPPGDFTVSLRSGWWRRGGDPSESARACSARRGGLGASSYVYAVDWLGIRYIVEGVFFARDGSLLQLELVAPEAKRELVQQLGRTWMSKNREF